MKKIFTVLLSLFFAAGMGYAAEDLITPIAGFELDESSIDWTFSGGKVAFSMVDDPQFDDVPPLDGELALYVEYSPDQGGTYGSSTMQFNQNIDLTGMRELHISFYFLPDSEGHPDNGLQMRFTLPGGIGLGEHTVPSAGEWHELVIPIDPYHSENSLSSVNNLQIIFIPGAEVSGRLYIDNIFARRPANAPGMALELLYGLNKTNSGDDAPEGWANQSNEPPILGGAAVEPSEGEDYMELILSGAWEVNATTINAANDFDKWEQAIAIVCDVMMSDSFDGSWHNFFIRVTSSSGGTVSMPIRATGSYKGEWHTVGWGLDIGPHLEAILTGGTFNLQFVTQSAADTSGSIYVDNIRVGLSTSFTAATRSINPKQYEGGETFTVALTIDNTEEGKSAVIEENLPDGFTATSISNGGAFADGKITWDVTLAAGQTSLSYQCTAPASPTGQGYWSGTLSGDEIRGANTVFFISPELKSTMVSAPLLSNTVTLDGILGADEYTGANTYFFDHDTSEGNVAPGVHLSGNEYPSAEENVTFHIFHDDAYIYVAMDVVDPSLNFDGSETAWQDDSPELYFDGNMSRAGSKESTPFGPQLTVVGDGSIATSNGYSIPVQSIGSGHYSEEGKDSDGGVVYWGFGAAPKEDESGYVVEYRVDKEDILDPADRTLIGFEILMNSSEAGQVDTRTGKWGWHSTGPDGTVSEFWDNETGWGLLELLGGTGVSDWTLFE
ncbi:MAG: hypothetical protein JXR73_00425 [Candidatus Omnitrophica bacterium]|nr:hypothetical protein [Candidatus Omnitrophota bacterium]